MQIRAAVNAMHGLLGDGLRAVCLHGSAVAGRLRPDSDLDLLAVVGRSLTATERAGLLSALLRISGPYPAPCGGPRPVEVMVFRDRDLAARRPDRAEFVYGEWLRPRFEAGALPEPVSDPEHVLVLAQARHEARALFGPDPADLLPEIAAEHVRDALRAALPAVMGGLRDDTRNALLTLARMWRTATTGMFVPKDEAADWAMARLPEAEAATLAHARDAYRGEVREDWAKRPAALRQVAASLHRRVTELLDGRAQGGKWSE